MFLLFLIVVFIQITYYATFLSKFSFAKDKDVSKKRPPISILISCNNEAENLRLFLPKILHQNYPKFELVLIDDASTDSTFTVMQTFTKEHENIQIVRLPKTKTYSGNKKNALTAAIEQAKYEHLLFTDADCVPKSENWIANMASSFDESKHLVLGYGAYRKKSGWLNKVIRYETLLTAWQYFSYTLMGLPYMGVGRNMGYTKSLFQKAVGFKSHQHIKSGDDDLFVSQVATASNTALCWTIDSHTVSAPKAGFRDWFRQKRRHVTTASSYKPMHQFLLGLFFLSQILFFGLFFVLIIRGKYIEIVLLAVLLRYVFFYMGLIPVSKKLNEKDLIRVAPFLEITLISTQLCIFIANLIQKPKYW